MVSCLSQYLANSICSHLTTEAARSPYLRNLPHQAIRSMRWTPEPVSIGPDMAPTARAKAACSNSGVMCGLGPWLPSGSSRRPNGPRSPPRLEEEQSDSTVASPASVSCGSAFSRARTDWMAASASAFVLRSQRRAEQKTDDERRGEAQWTRPTERRAQRKAERQERRRGLAG